MGKTMSSLWGKRNHNFLWLFQKRLALVLKKPQTIFVFVFHLSIGQINNLLVI
jgi:hypothetical protein